MVDDNEFEVADSGASSGTPLTCGAIKKGCHVIIKDRPCKVVEVSASKTGKHGSAKINFVGIDIFTGKKMEACHPSGHTVYAPNVVRTECPVLSIDPEGYLELMMSDNSVRSDINAEEMLEKIQEKYDNLNDNEELLVWLYY